MNMDITIWWIGYLLAALIVPGLLVAYLSGPRQQRIRRTRQVNEAVKQSIQGDSEVLFRFKQAVDGVEGVIKDLYDVRNYLLPIGGLTLVLLLGFFSHFLPSLPALQARNAR